MYGVLCCDGGKFFPFHAGKGMIRIGWEANEIPQWSALHCITSFTLLQFFPGAVLFFMYFHILRGPGFVIIIFSPRCRFFFWRGKATSLKAETDGSHQGGWQCTCLMDSLIHWLVGWFVTTFTRGRWWSDRERTLRYVCMYVVVTSNGRRKEFYRSRIFRFMAVVMYILSILGVFN